MKLPLPASFINAVHQVTDFALNRWLDWRCDPQVLAEISTNPKRPVCYVLHQPAWANQWLLTEQIQRLGLSPVTQPMLCPYLDESESYLVLTQGHFFANNAYSERLQRLVQAVSEHPDLDVLLVPVSIFWGQAPDDEKSLLRLLTRDDWGLATPVRQLLSVLFNGQQAIIHTAAPLSLRALTDPSVSPQTLTQKVTRILRIHFRHQRERVLGPDLSHQRNFLRQIMRSVAVQQAIQQEANEKKLAVAEVEQQAAAYVHEIVADYSYPVIRAFELGLQWFWRYFNGIEVRHIDRLERIPSDARIVYVPCHRSQLDGLLLAYVLMKQGISPPHHAAGINLNAPVIGSIIRRSGGFFLRRSFKGNYVYSSVLSEYLHVMTRQGFSINYFIEAGRSRTGYLLKPRMGMLLMSVKSFLRYHERPLYFVPIYLSYERLLEGGSYIQELRGQAKKPESIGRVLKALKELKNNYGSAYVSFGEPIDVAQHLTNTLSDWPQLAGAETSPALYQSVENLALTIQRHINRAAVVNPVNLLCMVLLAAPAYTLSQSLLLAQLALYQRLAWLALQDWQLVTSLTAPELLTYAHSMSLVEPVGDMVVLSATHAHLMSYFSHNVMHVYLVPSLMAAWLVTRAQLTEAELWALLQPMYTQLRNELFLPWSEIEVANLMTQYSDVLLETGLVRVEAGCLLPAAQGTTAYEQLQLLAAPAMPYLEHHVEHSPVNQLA